MATIYNLFKFIEDKKPQYKTPFKVKFIYNPNSLTKKELNVKGYLDLSNTPIQSLPNDLKVGRSLWLTNTPIQSLPNDLKVGGNLNLSNTPLSKKYTTEEQLKAKYPNIKVKGDIYLK